MNDQQFDESDRFDDAVRQRLRAGAAVVPDASTELSGLRPRFERARRRRQATLIGASGIAASIVVVLAVVAGGSDRADQVVDVAGDPSATTTITTTATTVVETTTTALAAPATTVVPGPTAAPDQPMGPTTTTAPAPTVPSGAPGTAPSIDPGQGAGPVPSSTAVSPGGTQVVTSAGGSATVRWDASSVLVEGLTPADGWEPGEVDRKTATRVVIHFRRLGGGSGSGSGESTIDVRVVDGRLEWS